ncbi:hypothetical protein LJB96_00880 [Methanobrevibacter sp. OttesenSCG-928-K11]|nr:hypothetical protein [Methanobrevibacter sp. OttesenSCG-928-K11]MDL2271002.1 hypothetical protein [Methanobrevibacter sp. OttesenSCG-928-I08]
MFGDLKNYLKPIIVIFFILVFAMGCVNASDIDANSTQELQKENIIVDEHIVYNNSIENSSEFETDVVNFYEYNESNTKSICLNNYLGSPVASEIDYFPNEYAHSINYQNNLIALNITQNIESLGSNFLIEDKTNVFTNYFVMVTYSSNTSNLRIYGRNTSNNENELLVNIDMNVENNGESTEYQIVFINGNETTCFIFKLYNDFKINLNIKNSFFYEENDNLFNGFEKLKYFNNPQNVVITYEIPTSSNFNTKVTNTYFINDNEKILYVYLLESKKDSESDIRINFSKINTVDTAVFISRLGKGSYYKFISFYNNLGVALANSVIIFRANGVVYSTTTDEKGMSCLAVDLVNDNFTIDEISCQFNSDIYYNIINKNTHNLIKYYVENNKYFIKILDYEGEIVRNKTVFFEINGITYSKTTDYEGITCLDIDIDLEKRILTVIHPLYGFKYTI